MGNGTDRGPLAGFESDARDYWRMRDELLSKHRGKWVAVHRGRLVAVGDSPVSIMREALAEDGYAYTNKVGEEDRVVVRQRRASFAYDLAYSPTAIPRIAVVFRDFAETRAKGCSDAIPDTGADVTCLPEPD